MSDMVRPFNISYFSFSNILGEVYYLLYADDYEIPSKVALNPEEPSLGRIRADSVAPPHSPASIKRCVSRVERNPALALPGYADLFADTSSDTPFKEGHISILPNDGPGLTPDEPMAIVQVKNPSIPDGKYIIKNRTAHYYWCSGAAASKNPVKTVYFHGNKMESANKYNYYQVNNHSPIIQVFKGLNSFKVGHHTRY